MSSDEAQDGLDVVGFAVGNEGFRIEIECEHDYGERPNVDSWGYMCSREELLGTVVADRALLLVALVASVVKAGQIPVDELHFVELEGGAY